MENNITENIVVEDAAEIASPEVEAMQANEELDEITELTAALAEAHLKLSLLLCGTAKEKLSEAARLASGLINAGMLPDEAAEKTLLEYPHLRLTTREIPVFAAESKGSGDGFAAIRNIFAKR